MKISVVTATFNSARTVRDTLDGGSTSLCVTSKPMLADRPFTS